jgi:Uma2 family endonuclease
MSTAKRLITADELIRMPEDEFRYELVKGELRRKPLGGLTHSMVSSNLVFELHRFAKANRLGVVLASNTGFQLAFDPDTVLAPDGAFIRRDRVLEAGGLPEGYWPGAPDLAVEVISPDDTYTDVDEKVIDWLEAGTRIVIVINPWARSVMVHRSPTDVVRLTESDTLTLGDLVPGFEIRVAELFEDI